MAAAVASTTALAAGGTDVRIVTKSQPALEATFFAASVPAPAAVIFRNCDETRGSVAAFATALQARGVSVVTYEYRTGDAPGKTYRETRLSDMEDVHDWLVRQAGVQSTRLAAIGGSCGVLAALDFARRYAPDVRAAVVMSGGGDEQQRAFVRSAAHLAVFGIGSRPEGAPELIDAITNASSNPATRRVMLEERRHGTFMLDDAATRDSVIAWLLEQLAAPVANDVARPARTRRDARLAGAGRDEF
jgi:dienelactone hydrolase